MRFLLGEAAWLLAAFAVTVLVAQALQALGDGWADAAPGAALFGLHGLIGIHVLRANARSIAAWLAVRGKDLAWGAAGGALLLAFNVVYGKLLDTAGVTPPDMVALLRELLPMPALILWAGFLAPVVEEMYFRGRLTEAFDGRVGPRWSGVITSAAFAAIHGIPVFIPAYLVFAAVLLGLRRKTGGLIAPIVAHVINNTAALV
ncbi:MAG TPA: CPBP family intramembrane glutamic endopeptidase [Candidatus Polarisedimenticolaceae bacterium]|nr:CPBP family intramembrane glutamic endopeptidase [Candidatus Polarisedimenticolaceae bacterium]